MHFLGVKNTTILAPLRNSFQKFWQVSRTFYKFVPPGVSFLWYASYVRAQKYLCVANQKISDFRSQILLFHTIYKVWRQEDKNQRIKKQGYLINSIFSQQSWYFRARVLLEHKFKMACQFFAFQIP